MGTPAVIFTNSFLYEWHIGDLDYSDYISRESSQIPLLKPDDDNDYYGYMSRPQAQGSGSLDNDTEYTTIFDAKNDFLTKQQINDYRQLEIQSQKEGCPKYIPCMSFDNQFLINNGLMTGGRVDIQKIKEVSRKAMNSLINTSDKLDPTNVYWTADVHVNTGNIHVHFSLLEYHRLVDRKKEYARKGMDMLELKAFEKFKSTVANSIILEKRTPELTKFKRENLIPEFASSVTASKEIIDLMKKLPPPKPKVGWQYSRRDMIPYHEDINSCIDKIILSNETLRRQFNHYKNSLQILSDQYNNFYGDRVDPDVLSYSENQMNDFYCRAGNKLLQALNDMRNNDSDFAYGVSKKEEKEILARTRSMETDKNISDAIKYLDAQKHRSPYLQLTLGRLCLTSTDTEIKGISILRSLAESTDKSVDSKVIVSANSMLGYWYLKKEENEKAEKYLLYASEHDDMRSQFQLSKLYVDSDMSKSIQWLTRSADFGFAPAQSSLGLLLFRSGNHEKALHYLNLAAKQDNIYAKRFLERIENGDSKKENNEQIRVQKPAKVIKAKKHKSYQFKRNVYAARHQMALCWSAIKQLLEEYERHIRELQEEFNEMNNIADDEYDFDYEYTI
ncbi:MAG: hypothetical protein IJ571_00515 [Ruminococcus sp.]|nr:hypothetical protein [Ruminococcus sp.]